jgi:Protein of unknown function (DUF2752)
VVRKLVFYTRVWVTLLAPFVLLLLPVDFFDHGESICLSKQLAGLECPACGLTRGVMHFVHLDFAAAWQFNKITFLVVPLMFPLWVKALYEARGKELPPLMNKYM